MQKATQKADGIQTELFTVPIRIAPPRLLIEWEPWLKVFLRNLLDLFRPVPPPLILTSPPAAYWRDVFVIYQPRTRTFAISLLYHAGLVAYLSLLPFLMLLSLRPSLVDHAAHKTLTYYQISDYLPPIHSPATAQQPRKGQPAFARQPIVSLPAHPDNSEQTVVDPSSIKIAVLPIKLPNLAIWTPIPAPPAAAITRATAKLIFPVVPPQVVPPPVQAAGRQLSQVKLPSLPQPSVIEPPPSPDSVQRKLGAINIAHVEVEVEQPKLPAPEQRASGNTDAAPPAAGKAQTPTPSPAPSLASLDNGKIAGQLIALGLSLSVVEGPIEVPGANRRGEFEAGPTGKPGAPGTPDTPAATNTNGGKSASGNNEVGLSVGAGPVNPGAAVVAQSNSGQPPGRQAGDSSSRVTSLKSPVAREVATLTQPPVMRPAPASPDRNIEDSVFGAKKYYSLTLNMPNLTSAGGSWIIRFAELQDHPAPGALTAPVAVEKVDPAYPPDLIRDQVEGTVTLYAVILSNGRVGEVHVLRSVDSRLDESARHALTQWRFQPATKNGSPVDLEAVVQIPFKLRKLPF